MLLTVKGNRGITGKQLIIKVKHQGMVQERFIKVMKNSAWKEEIISFKGISKLKNEKVFFCNNKHVINIPDYTQNTPISVSAQIKLWLYFRSTRWIQRSRDKIGRRIAINKEREIPYKRNIIENDKYTRRNQTNNSIIQRSILWI